MADKVGAGSKEGGEPIERKHQQPHPSTSAANDDTTTTSETTTDGTTPAVDATTTDKTANPAQTKQDTAAGMAVPLPELDDFGLPIRQYSHPAVAVEDDGGDGRVRGRRGSKANHSKSKSQSQASKKSQQSRQGDSAAREDSDGDEFKDALPIPQNEDEPKMPAPTDSKAEGAPRNGQDTPKLLQDQSSVVGQPSEAKEAPGLAVDTANATAPSKESESARKIDHSREPSTASSAATNGVSEFSHQGLTAKKEDKDEGDDGEWQDMPAYAPYDIYDDDNKLVAREHVEDEDESYGYSGLGGAGKGYTRVIMDDDAQSATSLDDNTKYLFNEAAHGTSMVDEEQRDAVSQMQATKDLLTEGQRIAYVGLTRLEISKMVKEGETTQHSRKTKKEILTWSEALKMWGQKMMIRLYAHMEISSAEQIMIEQLDAHGVEPKDLTPVLMANSRVKNPMAEEEKKSPRLDEEKDRSPRRPDTPTEEQAAEPPPAYEMQDGEDMPDVKTPSQLPTSSKIDIDLRWTVLCDLFLVLIADSVYDARSRLLLERVAGSLDIPWIDICRFEKRVTDALEMQQQAEKENWNEDEHMEHRRKMALKKRYVMMGLATVGGGLVIGLSAGLLAPLIATGLAGGFAVIGATAPAFLTTTAGAAIITTGAAASGSAIGIKAANRRTGAVKTFEYRPLHNNKRVNLIVTVSGWLTGKVDDVRLPFSTVDSIMGDVYSVLWEPEMLRSMGDTINILATEALTQGLQQILGSTILISLMAALQLPIVLTKLSYLIDNPWAVSLDRATAAGLILADSLIDRNLGTRPITLIGYSLGSRVIFSCLQELARKGAYGLIQNVYLFGSPIVVKTDEYLRVRTVVSGRFVNGYNRNDWILGYLFRLTNGGIRRVAGLAPIEDAAWIENMDCTEFVVGHMDYRQAMPRLLKECGWMTTSDEFTEIEDPDPENHGERQRELINEIEEARKELEKSGKPSKGMFNLFGRRKKALEKQEWEVYEDSAGKSGPKTEDRQGNNHGVLFDVDAIRTELARDVRDEDLEIRDLQVKELQSTLPPMKLDLRASPSPTPSPRTPQPPPAQPARESFRETLSADDVPRGRSSHESRVSAERTPTFSRQQRMASPAYFEPEDPEPDHIQMTFDTSFDPRSAREITPARTPRPEDYEESGPPVPRKDSPPRTSVSGPASAGRSEARTPTMPSAKNPWADPDDDDFGKEQEIQMTFA